jgi:hypothetical protein
VHDQVAAARRVGGFGVVDAETGSDLRAVGVDVDEGDPDSGDADQHPGHAAADHPGADDRDPVTDQWGRVPQRVHRSLHRAGEDGPLGRHVVGDGHDRGGRDDVLGLMRVEAEDGAPGKVRRPLLDDPHAQVAVLHRSGEVALLERRPHPLVLGGGDPAREHQRLGAAADRRPHGTHAHLVVARLPERDGTDLAHARLGEPEGQRLLDHDRASLPRRHLNQHRSIVVAVVYP